MSEIKKENGKKNGVTFAVVAVLLVAVIVAAVLLYPKLSEKAEYRLPKIVRKLVSKIDGTIKYLLEYSDGNVAECVLMRFDNRPNLTACVSSQIGCPVGCVFCATGKNGFVRNLTSREIVEQIMIMQRDTGLRISNVVFMGQGEPLLNIDNVLRAIRIINNVKGLNIGARHISISTSGNFSMDSFKGESFSIETTSGNTFLNHNAQRL